MNEHNNRTPLRFIIYCMAVVLLLVIAALWSPEIWALPYEFVWRITTALIIITAACGAAFVSIGSGEHIRKIEFPDLAIRIAPWLLMCGLFAWAVLTPMRTFFYGDGGLLIPQIYKLAIGESYQYDLLLNVKSSPLAGIIIIGLSHGVPGLLAMFGLPLPETGLYPFHWLSIICLIALVTGIILLTDKKHRLTYVLYIFGTAGLLFYFGYVEYYTLAFTAITLYLLAAERTIREKGSVILPVVLFGIAVAAHYETLALTPSLVFLIAVARGGEQKISLRVLLRSSAVIVVFGIAAYFAFGFHSSDSRVVMPLFATTNPSGTQSYTLLSAAHLRDMLNIVLLLAPVQFLVIVAMIVRRDRRMLFGSAIARYYMLAGVFFFCFLFFANTSLGLARDWDIAAPFGIILSLWALALLSQQEGQHGTARTPLILYAGFAALIISAGWVVRHFDQERSATRFETVLELDADKMYRDYAHSGYEALRKYYMNADSTTKDIAFAKKKIELLDYPNDYLYLIDKSIKVGSADYTVYVDLQRWMLGRLSLKAKALRNAGIERDYSISVAQIDSLAEIIAANAYTNGAYPELRSAIGAVASQTGAPQPYGIIRALQMYEEKRYPEAADLFQQSVDRDFHSPTIFRLFATSLALQQRYSEALAAIEHGIAIYPNDPKLLFTFADWLLKAGVRTGEARAALERAAVFVEDESLREEINRLLILASSR